jgi:hypothetical protein
MRTEDQIMADAADRPPFSNGTEGETWTARWCAGCVHDAAFQRDQADSGCPLLTVAILGRTPAEWFEQPFGEQGAYGANRYHCVEWRPEGEGPGGEPMPQPDPPGQGVLFGRDGLVGARMLTREPTRESV